MTTCLCILLPPVGVAMKGQGVGHILLSILLTFLWWIPGVIHALLLTDKRAAAGIPQQQQSQQIVVNVAQPQASPSQSTTAVAESPDRAILRLARENPVLSLRDVVTDTSLSIEEAEEALKLLVDKKLATEKVREDGKIEYDFS